ncbi:helix-turn-helix transcriptional regulator [Streptomyces sp. OE57]|uniref:helix-turn-helix transcriptional regulator n=1 Tax=Streptomyces lacaronensis TaxID=3379885 RepID=UPI0039B73363
MRPLRLALSATDPITRQGVTAALSDNPQVVVLPDEEPADADAGLVLATEAGSWAITLLERLADQFARPDRPLVMVADSIDKAHLLRAIGGGLVSFLPRSRTSVEDLITTLLASTAGYAALPQGMARTVVQELRLREQLDDLCQLRAGALSRREVDILALIAEGMTTSDVAAKLNYSERTIKAALHTLITRRQLRNRAHAVAYAIRIGAI